MSNTAIVEAFVDAWNRMDWDAVVAALDEQVVYHNIPMQPIHGRTEAEKFIRGMQPKEVDWSILAIAEAGNQVLTERVDNFVMGDGKRVSLPVMGVFELEEGRITAWRDYFDLASFTSQLA